MNFFVRSFFSYYYYYFSEQFNSSALLISLSPQMFHMFWKLVLPYHCGLLCTFLSQLNRKVCIPVFSLVAAAAIFCCVERQCLLGIIAFCTQLFMLYFHYFHCHHILFAMRFEHEYELKFKAFIYCACIVCGEQYPTLLSSLPFCSTLLHGLRAPLFF